MGKEREAPTTLQGMSLETREKLVYEVFKLATAKAKTLRSGDEFSVTLPSGMVPADSHYGEIVGELINRAERYGLAAGIATSWTYPFIMR